MALTPGVNGVPVPHEVYGSWVTETSPTSLPAGCSPDNQDVAFGPGSLDSRPVVKRVFHGPFASAPLYEKSYVQPNGDINNLYLEANGTFSVEDVTNNPGTRTTLLQVATNSLARSVTAFGREYIAFSDGLHGTEVPVQYDGTNLDRVTQDGPGTPPTVTSVILSASVLNTLTRAGNLVTGTTAGAHNLKPGYLAQIAGTTASAVGGGIATIVINNEQNPGLALVTTNSAHGLVPQNLINILNVPPTAVGGGIATIYVLNQLATLTTNSPHGLGVGSEVLIQTSGGQPLPFTVSQIISPTQFSYFGSGPGPYTGGTVTLIWPLASTSPGTNYFTVESCPTATSFYVPLSYPDGTWTGGTLTIPWDGKYFVKDVPSATTFTYTSYGPALTFSGTATVTPYGQAAPGQHRVRLSFLTRQGAITKPSPWVIFEANGGQYLQVSQMAIGPTNITARILEFTGAEGDFFFYLPVAPQDAGQLVGTATQINDNTTTTILLDFADTTLFTGIGTSTPGNDTNTQIVLDGALGFANYDTRLLTFGQRNVVQGILNRGFDGGTIGGIVPTGWTTSDSAGRVVPYRLGSGWQVTATGAGTFGTLSQPVYIDINGAPIITPNTQYTFRARISTTATFVATLSGTGFTATASITGPGFVQANFSAKTPVTVPNDLVLTYSMVAAAASVSVLDETNLIYSDTPYLDGIGYGSYGNNPEGISGVSGKFGPSEDTRKVMELVELRSALYILTREPSGRLHEVLPNQVTEPIGWDVEEIAANCGALSAFATSKSQADSSTSAGGEEWFTWASESGARIFGGGDVWKISQEIQPNWFDPQRDDTLQINMAAALRVWCVNDSVQRQVYYGLPLGNDTRPTLMYVLNYRELDSAAAIAGSPPYRISSTGRYVATDNTRKWTRWNLPAVNGARIYRDTVELSFSICAGTNCYVFDNVALLDDDFGIVDWYYITHFGPTHDQAVALNIGAGQIQVNYQSAQIAGVGTVTFQAYPNDLSAPWPVAPQRAIAPSGQFYLEHNAGMVKGSKIAYKISVSGPQGSKFNLNDLVTWYVKARRGIRGRS